MTKSKSTSRKRTGPRRCAESPGSPPLLRAGVGYTIEIEDRHGKGEAATAFVCGKTGRAPSQITNRDGRVAPFHRAERTCLIYRAANHRITDTEK